MSLTAFLERPMAKDAKSKARFEFKAPRSWIDRAEKVAESLGLGLSAYVRLVVTEDMDRRERERRNQKE